MPPPHATHLLLSQLLWAGPLVDAQQRSQPLALRLLLLLLLLLLGSGARVTAVACSSRQWQRQCCSAWIPSCGQG
jgi:hypothetical protein